MSFKKKHGLSKEEIDSHSSALTNQRINGLLFNVSIAEYDANNAMPTTIQHAISYHASLLSLYFDTCSLFERMDDDGNVVAHEIDKRIKFGEKLAFKLKTYPSTQKEVELLVQNCKQVRLLIHMGLQKYNYFFRVGQKEVKGIKEALSIFEQDLNKEEYTEELDEEEKKD